MTTVDVSDDTMEQIEELQEVDDYKPAKKDIVGRAVDLLHEQELGEQGEEQTSTEAN